MTSSSNCLTGKIVALSGGVGGAKLALGIERNRADDSLLVAVNVADDFEHFGLHISPDIDTVLYTLSSRNDWTRGWGREAETWRFMESLRTLGAPDWFQLGDTDLATHVVRTSRLREGETLSSITSEFAASYGIAARVVPASDDSIRTMLMTDDGAELSFQDYFVKCRAVPRIRGVRLVELESARPSVEFMSALRDGQLAAVIVCPSNPILSIEPILSLKGIRETIVAAGVPVIAVSPLRSGKAFKGPTIQNLLDLGHEPTSLGVARYYSSLLTGFVLDKADQHLVPKIEELGLTAMVTDTVMETPEHCQRLGKEILNCRWPRRSGCNEPAAFERLG